MAYINTAVNCAFNGSWKVELDWIFIFYTLSCDVISNIVAFWQV